jgi:translocation and assembly module TamB
MSIDDHATAPDKHKPQSRRTSITKLVVIALSLFFVLIVAFGASLSILISTSAGSKWLINKALTIVNSDSTVVSFDGLEGNLLWGIQARDIRVETPELSLAANHLRSSWQPLALLYGQMNISSLILGGVKIHWRDVPSDTQSPPMQFPALPLSVLVDDISIIEVQLDINNQLYSLDSLELSARLEREQLTLETINLKSPLGEIAGATTVTLAPTLSFSASLDWHYLDTKETGFPEANGHGDIAGNLESISINHSLLNPLQIDSLGSITLSAEPIIDLQHTLLAQSIGLPDADAVSLHLNEVSLHSAGALNALTLEGQTNGQLIPLDSTYKPQALNASWRVLLGSHSATIAALEVSTATGRLQTSGAVDWSEALTLDLTFDIQESTPANYRDLPEALELSGISANGSIMFTQEGPQWRSQVSLREASAVLNDYPLTASGTATLTPDNIVIDNLELNSASNSLAINGEWSGVIDITWRLNANSLNEVSDLLTGQASGTGHITGSPSAPQLQLSATGNDIGYQDNSIGQLTLSANYYNNSNQFELSLSDVLVQSNPVDSLTLKLTGQLDNHELWGKASSELGTVDVHLAGALTSTPEQHWEGSLLSASVDTSIGPWQLKQATPLSLQSDSALVSPMCWSQQQIELCAEGRWDAIDGLQASIALDTFDLAQFNALADGGRDIAQWFPHLAQGNRIEGQLSASASVKSTAELNYESLVIQASLNAGTGTVFLDTTESATTQDTNAETVQMQWHQATLDANFENSVWKLQASTQLVQGDLAATELAIQGNMAVQLTIAEDQSLDGAIQAKLNDLAWTQAFVSDLAAPHGSLSSDLIISGTLEQPITNGTVLVENAGFEVPSLGIKIYELDAALLSQGSENFSVQGSARSGEGTVSFASNVIDPFSESWSLEATISGDSFELTRQENMHLTASPDLKILLASEVLDVQGTLLLPTFEITLSALPESAVNVSPDAIIVTQTQRGEDVANAANTNLGPLEGLNISSELRVELGKNVHFSGFGLNTKLEGALDISRNRSGSALTYGELRVLEGNYRMYGRTLEIEHGKLLFFGSLTNPALDIRAVRQANNIKVGLQMNGTLRNIRSQLFSTPSLPDGDIIAVMLTDRPFAEIDTQEQDSNALLGAIANLGIKQGQSLTNQVRGKLGLDTLAINTGGATSNSSLILGKYLTPNLFIHYGVGLFDTESVVSLDYTVTERVKIEAKSGNSQSVDITYTVER